MNLPLRIARRYFVSRKKTNFINVISLISMIGVGLGTAALVIVLSVFNGMEGLFRQLYGSFTAEIRILPTTGKTFAVTDSLRTAVRTVPGVADVAETLEDNALLTFGEGQMIAKLRGVSNNYLRLNNLEEMIVAGQFQLWSATDSVPQAIVGSGVQARLSLPLNDPFTPLQAWYPRNRRRFNASSPDAYQRLSLQPGAVFQIQQQYDDHYIFVPLSFAQELLEVGNKRSTLEIALTPGARRDAVQQDLQAKLGASYVVQNRDEQHAGMLRAIKIEKLFTYLALALIVAVASFNIFFSLTMLTIDKHRDIGILRALGATEATIRQIFLLEGALIAFTGAASGLLLGFLICGLQQTFGLISMGMETAVVEAYPVQMEFSDFALVALTIVIITLLVSWLPASRAARTNVREAV